MTIPQLPADKEQEYYKKLALIESNNNPKAKAKTSSASGLYQPIKSTWESYGYDWDDVFDVKLQNEFIERFTRDNANILIKAGCAVNFSTLYGAHFLGPTGFLKIMRATPTTPIEAVTGAGQRKANPSILKGTVADFTDWLRRKTGDDYTKRYTETGWVSGEGVIVPPDLPDPIPTSTLPPAPKSKNTNWAVLVGVLVAAAIAVWFIFFKR